MIYSFHAKPIGKSKLREVHNIYKLENLSKEFDGKDNSTLAVSNVNLEIEKGKIFGIIGFSGAGKSTLVRCLNLLEIPTSGRVIFKGKDLLEMSPAELRKCRQKIGMIFQSFNLLAQRNIVDNVCYPLEIAGMKKKEAREKALQLLQMVGLQEKAKSYPSQLSGGQKQRVAIARALATDPDVLLCDEATSALDPITTTAILELLKEINEKLGVTIVIITHEMRVVQQICDQVAVMSEGVIIEKGEVADLFASPESDVTKKLVCDRVGLQDNLNFFGKKNGYPERRCEKGGA